MAAPIRIPQDSDLLNIIITTAWLTSDVRLIIESEPSRAAAREMFDKAVAAVKREPDYADKVELIRFAHGTELIRTLTGASLAIKAKPTMASARLASVNATLRPSETPKPAPDPETSEVIRRAYQVYPVVPGWVAGRHVSDIHGLAREGWIAGHEAAVEALAAERAR